MVVGMAVGCFPTARAEALGTQAAASRLGAVRAAEQDLMRQEELVMRQRRCLQPLVACRGADSG
jgi:hypothetical protein